MATQEQIEAIAGLYVAYFDRAPDPAGLQFWIDQLDNGRDFATISQDFATSLEARDIYPFLANPELATTSPAAFVTSIYANLFGRAPEQAGLDFWVNVIDSGDVLPGDMVEAVMLGARNAVINGEFIQERPPSTTRSNARWSSPTRFRPSKAMSLTVPPTTRPARRSTVSTSHPKALPKQKSSSKAMLVRSCPWTSSPPARMKF